MAREGRSSSALLESDMPVFLADDRTGSRLPGVWHPHESAGNPEIAWAKKNKPDWEMVGTNANGHPKYQWIDAQNNVHQVIGWYGGGSRKAPIENSIRGLDREMGKCERGACNHAVVGAPHVEITEQQNAFHPYQKGQLVNYQDQPHRIDNHDFYEGQNLYDLHHEETGEQHIMVPHADIDGPLTTTAKAANILDPIHPTLSQDVWDDAGAPEPVLKPQHAHFITRHVYDVLERGGYAKPHEWLQLCLTGSLTTYQYSPDSDVDISLFVMSDKLPDWSRAEMIGLMIEGCDGTPLPGTPYPLQCFVVDRDIRPTDLYKQGLRSGYDIDKHHWIVPPDPTREYDVQTQKNGFYAYALESADKMERLLRYEPDKAVDYWHQIHQRRRRDQIAGKGDFSEANIVYKFLANRNLFPAISQVSGEHIANAIHHDSSNTASRTWQPRYVTPVLEKNQKFPHIAEVSGEHIARGQTDHTKSYTTGQSNPGVVSHTNSHDQDYRFSPRIAYPDQAAPLAYPPIMAQEARGNSRPVSHDEFQQLAAEGHQRFNTLAANTAPTTGLDANWQQIKDKAYGEALKPWGGVTVNAKTGVPLESDADMYALTAREPGMQSVSVPENPTRDEFHAAMDHAKARYQHLLEREGHHLGVFHDDDEGRIDIDPTLVVHSPHEVETIGAYTRALGGAYHFQSGDGFWPPHVVDST